MKTKDARYSVFKKLLAKGEKSPRNYAGVIASYGDDSWAWTDGYSLIGEGKAQGQYVSVVNSKHVKLSELKGSDPLVLHTDISQPNIKYPNLGKEITGITPTMEISLNADILINALEALKALALKRKDSAIKLQISEDRVKLFNDCNAWAVVCNLVENSK